MGRNQFQNTLGSRDKAIKKAMGSRDKAIKHDCSSKVKHEEYGIGDCIKEMHTLDEYGNITHYDVLFTNKVVKNVPVENLEVLVMKNMSIILMMKRIKK